MPFDEAAMMTMERVNRGGLYRLHSIMPAT